MVLQTVKQQLSIGFVLNLSFHLSIYIIVENISHKKVLLITVFLSSYQIDVLNLKTHGPRGAFVRGRGVLDLTKRVFVNELILQYLGIHYVVV